MAELRKIPDSENISIKDAFEERYRSLLGERYSKFIEYSLCYLRKSIRVNTLKISVSRVKTRLKDWQLKQVPWCKEGFWIEHIDGRRDVGNLLEHVLGYIYVQEAASMIPPIVLGPKAGEVVLDMCAAPGSKSTQLAQMMNNQGVLVANDLTTARISPLSINLQRCGVSNCVATLMHGNSFKKLENSFDKVLVDAPCSGTGTIRKSLGTLEMWNPNMIGRLAATQKKLLESGFLCLKSGGVMVYSTCTLEPEEDEAVVDYLLNKYGNAKLQSIKMDIKRSDPITRFESKKYSEETNKCLRIWPQDNDTEGFFVAKIKKC
ncbi:MAG: NOL1/NOP2/sun family putative RNA methylase [Candidatus Woesearchaeota archaeon]